MAFPDLSAGRPRLTVLDLMVAVAIGALPAAAVAPPRAPEIAGLAMLMLALGGSLWWLSGLGGRTRRLDPLILPALFALTMVYLVLCCIAFACDPGPATLILGGQVVALVYAAFRW